MQTSDSYNTQNSVAKVTENPHSGHSLVTQGMQERLVARQVVSNTVQPIVQRVE